MKTTMYATKIAATLALLLTFAGCVAPPPDNRTVISEEDKTITVLPNSSTEEDELPAIAVEKIDKYDGMEITDWLDEQTVVLARENRELKKMSLLENAEHYPRSIYLYNLDTRETKLVKARENMFLGGATLSPDKKHLLYYEYSIGDTAYFLMSMDAQEATSVAQESLGIAYTGQWTDDQSVIGASYAGGAYVADTARNITPVAELREEQLYTVSKRQDKVYYITTDGAAFQLHVLDLATKEKKRLDVDNADGVVPSPDGSRLLLTQWVESTKKLLLADADGNIQKTIAEGTEITGVSWSPDQRMIAYRLESVANGTTSSGLYLYDMLSGKSTQIAVNVGAAQTSWSPSGDKIAVREMTDGTYNSSIIYLKQDLP